MPRWRLGLVIADEDPGSRRLAFDLRDVLEALGEAALGSAWIADGRVVSDAPPDGAFAAWIGAGERVAGDVALAMARAVGRVTDGGFAAWRPHTALPWIEIHAVEGALWDVRTNEEAAVAALERRFRSTRRYEPDW